MLTEGQQIDTYRIEKKPARPFKMDISRLRNIR